MPTSPATGAARSATLRPASFCCSRSEVHGAPGLADPGGAALETVFRDTAATRMEGVPLLHASLQVQAVDCTRARGRLCPGGAGHASWFMNLMRVPLGTAEVLALGQVGPQRLGEHRLRFIGAHEAAFGPYEMCSLASPMFEFADQQAAVATAREVLVRLRSSATTPSAPDPRRRGFLLQRGSAPGSPAHEPGICHPAPAPGSRCRHPGAGFARAPGRTPAARARSCAGARLAGPFVRAVRPGAPHLRGNGLQALQTPETPIPMDAAQRQALWRETLREHVRRLFLDWPRLLASPAPEAAGRQPGAGPVRAAGRCGSGGVGGAPGAGHALGALGNALVSKTGPRPAPMGAWRTQPSAQALVQAHRWAGAWQMPLQALHTPQPGAQVLTDLANALRADGDFAREPWPRGQCRETGCWTRADDAWLPVPDVWTRLAARVGPGSTGAGRPRRAAPARRACALGMARPSPGAKWRAACWCTGCAWMRRAGSSYGVLAPTEWNFHPQGAAAQVLRGLDAQQPAPQLAAAVAVLVRIRPPAWTTRFRPRSAMLRRSLCMN
ncbi:MAG: [NiFe]-hydrogenase assembly chaperone HybE [Paenacidovorax caeni]